ncbi:hypothetical protein [Streptodolium elevatio]|uniref:Uncharacterized protein n=1 Tax=Streptodolium elevatio TaxID=3157996 RepID=A0ABV3D9F7_9ACTN
MARSRRRRSSATSLPTRGSHARGTRSVPGQSLDLAAAAARVAERFAGSALRSPQDGCGHCFDERELLLLATPDAQLTRDLAMRAAWKAHQFDDAHGLMRRVLPSLAAAIVDREYDMGRALRGLAQARFHTWPRSMAAPVLDLLDTWFLTTLRAPGTGAHLVLEACAAAGDGVGRWLAMWEREKTPVADAHLAQATWWWAGDCAPPSIDWLLAPEDVVPELCAWLAGYAAERMAAYGAPPEMVRRLRGLVPPPGSERGADETGGDGWLGGGWLREGRLGKEGDGAEWDGALLPRPEEWPGVRRPQGSCT